MKKTLLFLAFLVVAFQVEAQQLIKGKVTDDTNSSLPGVSIQVKNTLRGTFTDLDGNYSISAAPADTLVFSMVGTTTQRIRVGSQTVINVKLLTEATSLSEVVVIGYGTQKVKDLTAPIVTIKGDELNKQMTSNAMQALQGKIAGVQIINSGAPGAGSGERG